jgi:amidase
MTGMDERDEATRPSRGKALTDYTKFLDPKGLKGARIGVYHPRSLDKNPLTNPVLAEALAAMKAAGATIVDPVKMPSEGKSGNAEFDVLLYELKADLNRYLADFGPKAPVHTLKEVIEFNERHRDRVMPYFGQEIFLQAEAKGPLTDAAYRKALATCRLHFRKEGIDAMLAQHKLDALVAPTGGPAWLIDLVNGDSETGGSSSLAAVAGYPSITVPAGFAFGLPLGISFIGAAWSEPTLIRLAYAFEAATKARKAPRFRPTAELS